MSGGKAYDAPGPIEVSVYEGFPGAVKDRHGTYVLPLTDVRSYFAWIESYGATLLDRFKILRSQVEQNFEALPDGGDTAFSETLKLFVEETPIRAFKEELGEETYNHPISEHSASRTKQKSSK